MKYSNSNGQVMACTEREISPYALLSNYLEAHHRAILQKELSNTNRILMYNVGGSWIALEHSAYQLGRLFPDADTAVFNFKDYPFPVVFVSIDEADLKHYSTRHIFRVDEPDYKEIPVPRLSPDSYNRWYRETVEEFMGTED